MGVLNYRKWRSRPWTLKAPGCLSAGKGLDLLSLRGRLLTAKLTSAGTNVTILKLSNSASIDKVDGSYEGRFWIAENEELAETTRAVGHAAGLHYDLRPGRTSAE